jgi:hypothetical protein
LYTKLAVVASHFSEWGPTTMTRPKRDHFQSDADGDEPLLSDSPDGNVFLPDDDECLSFSPDDDPLGDLELDDFGLDDQEQFPDERDYSLERDED